MQVTFHHIESVTPTIKTFWFKPERPVRYIAGQFTELHLPHESADERGIRRWFTLSSSPTEELLSVTTRFEPVRRSSSFKQQLAALQPGAEIHLADPMGDFVLPKDPLVPLVFVAVGLGITPVRSMIKWLHDTDEQRNIKLIYIAPEKELAFDELFRQYGLEYNPVTTNQRQVLQASSIINRLTPNAPLIYLSGPELLVETLYKDLQKVGIAPGRLVCDYFPGYTTVLPFDS